MAISLKSGDAEDEVNSSINTTPLVDVMLVLLIIFLITIPVVRQTVQLNLPSEKNIARQTRPENIEISVDSEGKTYWNGQLLASSDELFDKLKVETVKVPQPEVHIRGDQKTKYEHVGRVMFTAQRAAIAKISFVTEPPANH